MLQAWLFLSIVLGLVGFTLVALIALGVGRLTTSVGIHRDGYPPGTRAPQWSHVDTEGQRHQVPSGGKWQLLLFADHSLRGFPTLIGGLHAFLETVKEVELLILPGGNPRLTTAVLEIFRLHVPVIPVSSDFYYRHRVRVMPFGLLVDPEGVIRATGLVNSEDAPLMLWRRATLPMATGGRRSQSQIGVRGVGA